MKTLIAAASAAAIACAAPAIAQAQTAPTGVYAGVNYANAHADDVNLGAIQGRLGYRFNNWLGVEGELAAGIKSDDTNVLGTDVSVKLKHEVAAYGVGFLPISPNTDLLARIGYGNTKIKASAGGASLSDDGDSWNFGVGAQHHFDGVNGVRVDYTRQEFTGDGAGHADVWSIGYTRRF
ncbi:MAG: porin family protein [Phenylobacterium sp.]